MHIPPLKLQLWICCAALFLATSSYSQTIPVSLPDTSGDSGTSITIPILVGNLTGRQVLAYTAIVSFDTDVLRIQGASSAGTLSQSFGQLETTIVDSLIVLSDRGSSPLLGSGALVNLNFDVIGQPGKTSGLNFRGFLFNTGIPPNLTTNGRFTVRVPTAPEIRVDPLLLDFGNVQVDFTARRNFKIVNDGTADLVVSAINVAGPDAQLFNLENGTALLRVAPRDSQNLVVAFSPNAPGSKLASLQILSNDADEDTVLVTLTGNAFAALQLAATIISPQDGAVICPDSVTVEVQAQVMGGLPPVTVACSVNGVPATQVGSSFVASLFVAPGENVLAATCTAVDALGNSVIARDTVRVVVPDTPTCTTQILSPLDSAVVTDPTISVSGITSIEGGQPPFAVSCVVNGVPATISGTSFSASLPLVVGENLIVATCTVVDSCGNQVVCSDTVRVFREATGLVCEVEIVSPTPGEFVCDDSVDVTIVTTVQGGVLPITIDCTVNGFAASGTGSTCEATVPVNRGANELVVVCLVTDGAGNKVFCADTVTVFQDTVPPTCSFAPRGLSLVGAFVDTGTGIASIRALDLRNANLVVDPFVVGDKVVGFRIDVIDFTKPFGFNIEVMDVCGNRFICDPIFFTLMSDGQQKQIEFMFPHLDRYFQLKNRGLAEVRIDLNGQKFRLVADQGAPDEPNVFSIPREGVITFDLNEYLHEGENSMHVIYEGPSGSHAEMLLLNEVEELDFVLHLERIPSEFRLAQNYPNPFNPSTRIPFEIPDQAGHVQVKLSIYNVLGELVRVMVDEETLPGQYVAEWDGTDRYGVFVSSGIYLYRIVAGEFRQTKRMILLR